MKVAVVIPAWEEVSRRESFRLPEVIRGVAGLADLTIVVDDGSHDGTSEGIAELPIHLLRHPINRGQGAALKTGTRYALDQDADIIVHFDGDGQFRPEDVATVIEPIRRGEADAVFGSRFLDNTTEMPAFKERVIMPLARFVNRLFGIRLTDPQSGFRAFSRRGAENIDWHQNQMAHCSEILISAHRSGLPIKEVPITVLYPEYGQSLGGGFKILRDLFLAKLNQ